MSCRLLEKFPLDNFPESVASIEKQFQNKVLFWHYSCRTCFCWCLLGPANTHPWCHEPFSQNSQKIPTVPFGIVACTFALFFRQPFSKELYTNWAKFWIFQTELFATMAWTSTEQRHFASFWRGLPTLVDLTPRFARPEPQLCMISNAVMHSIYTSWRHLLLDLNQPWLSRPHLQTFTEVIKEKGAALQNCWGFIDGTVRPISRPGRNQRVMYNGHKKVHSIKFQSIAAPNGLIANLYGPVEGKRHDSAMLAQSQVLNQLQRF